MTLLSCITALSLSLVLIYPPLKLFSDVLLKQEEIEQSLLLRQNIDRAMELLVRAIREAGYREDSISNQIADIQIKKKSSYRGSDAIELTQDVPKQLAYDCMGNVLSKERTRHQKTYQHFYLERNRIDPRSAVLVCQSLDRQGRLHQAELLSHVQSLQIDWVSPSNLSVSASKSHKPSRLIKITLRFEHPSKLINKPIEHIRYVAPRHIWGHKI